MLRVVVLLLFVVALLVVGLWAALLSYTQTPWPG